MELLPLKYLLVFVFFAFSAVMVFLPLVLYGQIRNMRDPRRRHAYQTAISLVSCFGGGVFLATCLLHLLPEARSQLSKGLLVQWGSVLSFPLTEFLCILGLLLVLVIEQVALSWKETHGRSSTPVSVASSSLGAGVPRPNYGSVQQAASRVDGHAHHALHDGSGTEDEDDEGEGHVAQSVHGDPNSHSSLRSVVLVVSLSMHSVFEGIALGLQPSMTLLLQLLAAVSIHKGILAFTLGLNLVHSRLGRVGVAVSGLAFSLMAPLGMVLALLLVQEEASHMAFLDGCLQSLACGTFLYVTFFEVLPHEMSHGRNRLPKLLAIILGVGTITGLLFTPH